MNNPMKIITINLSEPAIRALQILQDLGLYPSRSEAIRVAIRDYLHNELGIAKSIEEVKLNPDSMASEKKKVIMQLLKKLREEQLILNGEK